MDRKRNMVYMVVKTVFMVLGPIALGIYLELAGPTLPDLKDKLGVDYEEISRVLVARSVGYFVSSLGGGILADGFPRHTTIFLACAFLLAAIGTALAPFAQLLWAVGLMFFLQGLGQGSIDTYNNAMCLGMWGKDSAAPVHALHFGFGIGAFIAPQLARPFLSSPATTSNDSSSENGTTTAYSDATASRIEIPYLISACINLAFVVTFAVLYAYERCNKIEPLQAAAEPARSIEKVSTREHLRYIFSPGSCTGGDVLFGAQFFALVFLFYFNAVGGERAYSKFIYSYAIDDSVGFDVAQATTLNSVFWIGFTCGRGVGILLSKWIPILYLLFVEIALCVLSGVVLAVWAQDVHIVLWIFSGVFGFFMSQVFPAGLAWSNMYVLMKGTAVSVVFVGSAAGGMVYQWLTGYLFEYHGAETLMYVILGFSLFLAIVFSLMQLVVWRRPMRFPTAAEDDEDEAEDVKMQIERENVVIKSYAPREGNEQQ